MSTFNTSTRREDMSLKLRAQNIRTTREQTKKLELESRKMEERLKELKMAMSFEKEEREKNGGGFWQTGQSGTLSTYATDVLEKHSKSAKESKRKSIKVLKDEPLDVPKRRSDPGTMKYIAESSKSLVSARDVHQQKGPKCGQCEDRVACLTCAQCSENYCSGCFAAFHFRGALKKHRSVPLQMTGPRKCMSPRPTPPASYREPKLPAQAAASVSYHGVDYQDSERNGPEGASGSYDTPSLLAGKYNEADSAASFQAALIAWRKGDNSSPSALPCKSVSPRKSMATIDASTATTEKQASPDIKFTNSLSYAERLLLKQHRRTDLDTLSNNAGDFRSPRAAWGSMDREDTIDAYRENRVTFDALYQASLYDVNDPSSRSRVESGLSISEVDSMTPRLRHVEQTDKYDVKEVDSNSKLSPINNSSLPPNHNLTAVTSKYDNRVRIENALASSEVGAKSSRGEEFVQKKRETKSAKSHQQNTDSHQEEGKNLPPRPKSRPVSRKSRQSTRPRSARQSRPKSRAFSRAASNLGEGVLTKAPSDALLEISSRLKQTETHVYSPTLQDFFLVGVKPSNEERTLTPTKDKHNSNIKVSNRLYQMAPRSWRPDSSLGEKVPIEAIDVANTETVISYAYSAQTEGHPLTVSQVSLTGENHPHRSESPLKSVSSPRLSQSKKASTEWSSRPAESRSSGQTEYTRSGSQIHRSSESIRSKPCSRESQLLNEESGRLSRAIVMDGDDLAMYDDPGNNNYSNEEDEAALNQLEWELASESGRITADGQVSRMSMIDNLSESGSSRSSTPVVKLSMDQGFDINIKLRDDELSEIVDENDNQMKDEQDVRCLQ